MTSTRTLGFIGLGVMGGPMSINLVTRSGHEVIAFDLSTESLDRVVDAGAKRGASVVDVAERAEVVFLCSPASSRWRRSRKNSRPRPTRRRSSST